MTQYQSFPEAPGDSRTLDKLKALNLPDLRGRRFLDVGCNEGFFCGFAKYQGAVRAVGVDYSAHFIERAKARFSECEFYRQDWSTLPEGEFDVILLASALHYADDQPALIRRLVDKLSPNGVLVLELGIVSQPYSDWVLIKRGIDERYFPTMLKLREVLTDYAWKWMGPSVSQDGDPVARHVVHISPRLPVAYLLMQPPAYGKSSIAAHLFPQAGVPVVSGDQQLLQLSRGGLSVSPELKQAVTQDFSSFRVDECVRRVFDAGLGKELVALWSQQVPAGESFALDAYVPPEHHHIVKSALAEAGYLPILLQWDRPGLHVLPADMAASRAETFFMSLLEGTDPASRPTPRDLPAGGTGHVDECTFADGQCVIRGWAVTASGAPAQVISVRLGQQQMMVEAFERQTRPDVQRHLDLPHPLFGYRLHVALPAGADPQTLRPTLEIRAGLSAEQMGDALPVAKPPASAQ